MGKGKMTRDTRRTTEDTQVASRKKGLKEVCGWMGRWVDE